MTTWSPAGGPGDFFQVHASNLAMPFMHVDYDGVSSATPLGLMKFEYQDTALSNLLIGNISGCIGETSGLLLLLGGIYMLWRRVIDWRIPASILLSVAVFSACFIWSAPTDTPDPLFSIFAGSLLIGAFYMATDPVSSPITPRGAWIFGIGIGLLVVLIRVFGGFPEGVMYAILLMNAATPLIDRYTANPGYSAGGADPDEQQARAIRQELRTELRAAGRHARIRRPVVGPDHRVGLRGHPADHHRLQGQGPAKRPFSKCCPVYPACSG